jgi:hypothetical protein
VSDDRSPLDPSMLALLRGRAAPTAAARMRVRARLAATVPGLGGPPPGGGPSGGPGAGGLSSAGGLGTPLIALAAFVVGGGVGAAIYAALSRPPPPAIVYLERPAPETVEPAAPSDPTASTPAPVDTLVAPRAVSAVPSSAAASRPSSLAAERAVLDQARAALVEGAPERSLERLERHRHDFPRALLGEEREAMWVEALVRVGRYDEARSTADAFRRRWPGSLFLPAVRAAVASIP